MNTVPYLALDSAIEEEIKARKLAGYRSPYAFDDALILRREDKEHDKATVSRSAFQRDIEKIVNVPAYNRYADKTQVFSFVENDDICRRGLHVQLVSSVARSIGRLLGLNLDLIEAIALGHDLGHTPFGHAGERFLSACYHERTGRYFNHNIQSVRVLDKLYPRNVSLQTLDGVMCHNGEFACQTLSLGEMPSFAALDEKVEACTANEQAIAGLRPSTLEGCVVRVSDMIAYLGKDREDALKIGALPTLDVFESSYIGVSNAQIINNMVVDIVNNSFGNDAISMSSDAFSDIVLAKRQNYELIYLKEGMVSETQSIVADMFEEVYERLLTDLMAGDESSPIFTDHAFALAKASRSIDVEEYVSHDVDQVVVDYISSMTDSYFMSLYRFLFPKSKKTVYSKEYFDGR